MAHRPDRAALPDLFTAPTFPFDGGLRVRPLEPRVSPEPPRRGEGGVQCPACLAGDDAYVWVDDRWRVRTSPRPTGLPMTLTLEPRMHLDLGDLPNLHAAELGLLTVRLERAIRLIDGVARVHVTRSGEVDAHLAVQFRARPAGLLQLRGEFLPAWEQLLAPEPMDRWWDNLVFIAAYLADQDGRAIVTSATRRPPA